MSLYEFPRTARLPSSGDFRKVFEQASFRAPHPCFLLLAIRNQHQQARLGLVVAKKHVRRSVDRNRIKRLIRESFRHQLPHLPPLDIVVLVRKEAGASDNRHLLATLDKLWARLSRQAVDSASTQKASE